MNINQSQGWRQLEGGLHALAARYGQHNDASVVRETKEQEWLDHDDGFDFKLPLAPPSEDFDFTGIQVVSLDTPIEDTNVGFRLLIKMGWQKNTGLGSKAQGITDPVRMTGNNSSMGLGKSTEFAETAVAATQERRKLRSEQLLNETKQESEKRREEEMRQQTIAEVVRDTLSVFNCKLCKAQYTTGEQWEEHLSSYQHHHRVRFLETRRFHVNKNMNGQQGRDDLQADKALEAQMAAALALDKQKLEAKAATSSTTPPPAAPALAATPTETTAQEGDSTPAAEAPTRAPVSFGGMSLGASRKVATAFSFSGKKR